ncbi:MAG: Mov34/MPN/PAD-1 family protein [Acidobacteriota bacterium]|nr:Mov34/MPN/PAD-1 family protein [Acidobacteriota bacterium]
MNIPQLVERKFLFAPDQPITAPLYEIVIAQNGVFKRAQRREMTAAVEISAFAVKIPELAVEKARVELIEKIPARIFTEILAHAQNETNAANFTENLYTVCRDIETGNYFWKEVSRHRSFGSTIARDDASAYQTAVLEIHTHPPGCREFSSQDDCDERGKFRLFGILVDIHSDNPAIRLRVGIYDSFWEIPAETIANAPLENLTDLVKQGKKRLAEIRNSLSDDALEYILAEEYRAATVNLSYVENL